jgi:hypothetical protein
MANTGEINTRMESDLSQLRIDADAVFVVVVLRHNCRRSGTTGSSGATSRPEFEHCS